MRPEKRIKILRVYLYIFGGVSLLAFGAAAMPGGWMIGIAKLFGIDGFPKHPLTWYLARHLSVMYGLFGAAVLIMAGDLQRYLLLIHRIGWGIVALGIMQLAIDLSAPMPLSWTLGEAASTAVGGAAIVYLAGPNARSMD